MSEGKDWNLDVLIPTAILHDIGHAAILPEHFIRVSGPKKDPNSKLVHMLTGAKIAREILGSINYPKDISDEIVEIIAIHDNKDKSSFDSQNKKLFHDIDRSDRISEEGIRLATEDFGLTREEAIQLLENEIIPDIIAEEFIKLAQKNLKSLKDR